MKNVNTMSETEKKARAAAFEWLDEHVVLLEEFRQYTLLEDLEIPEIIEWLEDEDVYGRVPNELYEELRACQWNPIGIALEDVKLSNGDCVDLSVNDEITIHVYRADCGYVVDVLPNEGKGEDLLGTLAIWDDDLIRDEEAI